MILDPVYNCNNSSLSFFREYRAVITEIKFQQFGELCFIFPNKFKHYIPSLAVIELYSTATAFKVDQLSLKF